MGSGRREPVISDVMETTIDPDQWKLEVERVLPALKMQHRHDNRVCDEMHVLIDRCHVCVYTIGLACSL